MDNLNPRFPYRMERAHWYLLFLYRNGILTESEFEIAIGRLNMKTGSNW